VNPGQSYSFSFCETKNPVINISKLHEEEKEEKQIRGS
jgi:hypothetical protein